MKLILGDYKYQWIGLIKLKDGLIVDQKNNLLEKTFFYFYG